MKFSLMLLVAAASTAMDVGRALAATASLSRSTREVTPEEIAGGAPAGGFVHDFFITSDVDLLSINHVVVDVPLFHDALGSNKAAPASGLHAIALAITADSYLTTPGPTQMLGGGFDATEPRFALWGDLERTGSLENFHIGRLTVGQTGRFSGRVSLNGGEREPIYLPFDFVLPGSHADLSLLATEQVYSLDYSLGPEPELPPAPAPGPNTPPADPGANTPPAPRFPHLSITRQSRAVTSAEIAGGAPTGGFVHEFFVTTETTIISVNRVNVDVPVFQSQLGQSGDPPAPGLEVVDAGVTASSFIDVPGETIMLGGGFAGSGDAMWGSLSNDGSQEDFLFARLTVEESGTFSGRISLRDQSDSEPIYYPFSFEIPATQEGLVLLESEGAFASELVIEGLDYRGHPASYVPEPAPTEPGPTEPVTPPSPVDPLPAPPDPVPPIEVSPIYTEPEPAAAEPPLYEPPTTEPPTHDPDPVDPPNNNPAPDDPPAETTPVEPTPAEPPAGGQPILFPNTGEWITQFPIEIGELVWRMPGAEYPVFEIGNEYFFDPTTIGNLIHVYQFGETVTLNGNYWSACDGDPASMLAAATGGNARIPEPTTWALALAALCGLAGARRR